MAPFYTYFAGIGLAFLMVEIAQLQRLSIYLGNPTYALTVVLFSILLSSGIGSMLTERFVNVDRAKTLVVPLVVLLVVVGIMGILTPAVLHATTSETTPTRIAIAVALLAPLGLAMGMPFAIGMRAAGTRPGAPTAFLWGINGALSVCASVFAVVIALFFGISRAFWTGWAAYLVALVAMAIATRRREPTERLPDEEPSGEIADVSSTVTAGVGGA
jgi:MFS family permease